MCLTNGDTSYDDCIRESAKFLISGELFCITDIFVVLLYFCHFFSQWRRCHCGTCGNCICSTNGFLFSLNLFFALLYCYWKGWFFLKNLFIFFFIQVFRALANLLELTNYSITFYIYCLFSEDFRNTLMRTIKWPWIRTKLCQQVDEVRQWTMEFSCMWFFSWLSLIWEITSKGAFLC